MYPPAANVLMSPGLQAFTGWRPSQGHAPTSGGGAASTATVRLLRAKDLFGSQAADPGLLLRPRWHGGRFGSGSCVQMPPKARTTTPAMTASGREATRW